MSEKLPVAWVVYVSDPGRPGISPMKDGEIVPVIDHGDLSYRNHCVYKDGYKNGKIFVNDTPGDSNWPSVELTVDDGKNALGWHGWYRAYSTSEAAEAWISRFAKYGHTPKAWLVRCPQRSEPNVPPNIVELHEGENYVIPRLDGQKEDFLKVRESVIRVCHKHPSHEVTEKKLEIDGWAFWNEGEFWKICSTQIGAVVWFQDCSLVVSKSNER